MSFINCHLQSPRGPGSDHPAPPARRVVTISRQTGSGGHNVAQRLLGLLQSPWASGLCPWAVFDRDLVEKVLRDHNLPKRLARFMPEDRILEISDTMDELFGLHPSSWTLVHKTADTILRLAELGHVILIGRGANVITRKLDYAFHVRLVGAFETRVRYIQEMNQSTDAAARELVRHEDLGRARYLKKYFDEDIENPLLYHLVINTDLVPHEEAAEMIAQAVMGKLNVPA